MSVFEKVMKPFGKIATEMSENMSQEDLEMMIAPIIDSIAPPLTGEPKCKLCKLLKQLILEQFGNEKHTDIILRLAIPVCEKDPTRMLVKLEQLRNNLGKILMERVEDKKEEKE